MPRISGIEVPNQKRGEIALTHIFGIGRSLANKILATTKIDINKKARDWTHEEADQIRKIITQSYIVEGNLRREIGQHKKRLRDINCYRGIRDRMGLPLRGQNTKTNARTRKGRGKPIATKKKTKK